MMQHNKTLLVTTNEQPYNTPQQLLVAPITVTKYWKQDWYLSRTELWVGCSSSEQ